MIVSGASTAAVEPLFYSVTMDAVKNQYQVMEEKKGDLDEKMRESIMISLEISDEGRKKTVRENQGELFVTVEKSPWYLPCST